MALSMEEAAAMFANASEKVPEVPVAEARDQARNARARVLADWPRDSGESGQGFTVTTEGDGARLFNPVRHAFFVNDGQAHASIKKAISDGELAAITRIERATSLLLEG